MLQLAIFYLLCCSFIIQGAHHRAPVGHAGHPEGGGLEDGPAWTIDILLHPTNKDVYVIVTKATDGRATVVKSVYDSDGRMVDCDVNVDGEEARRLVEEVEMERRSHEKVAQKHAALTTAGAPSFESVSAQVDTCQEFLQARMEESLVPQKMVDMEVEIEDDQQQPEIKRRQKRGYLIWPGTNWCGKGSKAEFAESYGENVATDRCCQKHDQCPYIIEGFTTKFNLFNYRIHTLSICDCDEKFMDCLKAANTSTSTMVAKVYFNVVNTECFDLKLQKTCNKRSWWGGCEKYSTKWAAAVRSLGKFPE